MIIPKHQFGVGAPLVVALIKPFPKLTFSEKWLFLVKKVHFPSVLVKKVHFPSVLVKKEHFQTG